MWGGAPYSLPDNLAACLPTYLPLPTFRVAHAPLPSSCQPFAGGPRGSACTVTTAATFAHHCASANILICAADHNSLSVSQCSSSITSVNYDHATIAQRCPMTHMYVLVRHGSFFSSSVAKNMPRQQTCPEAVPAQWLQHVVSFITAQVP